MYETLLVEKGEGIASITLNRPERLNAINDVMRRELIDALDKYGNDNAIKVIVIKGAGRAFCAGADVHRLGVPSSGTELHPGDTLEDMEVEERYFLPQLKVWETPRPVIAQIHGYCIGMGFLLALNCDLIIAAEDARLGNARIMVGGGVIGTRFVWNMGLRRAKWMEFLPGWRITGKEAVDWGIANMAVPAEKLEEEVQALAHQLARAPLTHLKISKKAMNGVWEQLGVRYTWDVGYMLSSIGHKSREGLEIEREFAEKGWIKVGGELYTEYPKRHNRA